MKILVFGASGFAGRAIVKELGKNYTDIIGTYHSKKAADVTKQQPGIEEQQCIMDKMNCMMLHYDLEDDDNIELLLDRIKPDVIINCLRGDFMLQKRALNKMLAYLKQTHRKLIFLSTANVFDGALESVHFENDTPKANSDYGKFKIECETRIKEELPENGIIIRIPEIYGIECPRVQRLREVCDNNSEIRIPSNFSVNVTLDTQIATWISYILHNNLTGIFHIGTREVCDYYEFQRKLVHALGLDLPQYQVETEPQELFQAVVPGRAEIPEELQLSVEDVIRAMI